MGHVLILLDEMELDDLGLDEMGKHLCSWLEVGIWPWIEASSSMGMVDFLWTQQLCMKTDHPIVWVGGL